MVVGMAASQESMPVFYHLDRILRSERKTMSANLSDYSQQLSCILDCAFGGISIHLAVRL